jgi:hypothetical protein
VGSQLHPAANSAVGQILLKNGKFVVCFVEVMARREKKDYLRQYLFNYFNELNTIEN